MGVAEAAERGEARAAKFFLRGKVLPVSGVSFLLVALIYVGLAGYLAADGAFWSPDAGARFAMIANWMKHGDIVTLRTGVEAVDPMGRVHGLSGYLAQIPGRTCTVYPPLAPLVSAPLYRAFGFVGLTILPVLCGLGTLGVTWLAARRLRLGGTVGIPLVLGLTTPLLIYSTLYWDHSIQMCVAGAALLATLRGIQRESRNWVWAGGALLGGGLLVHEVFLVLMAAAGLAGWACADFRRHHLLPLVGGMGMGIAVWMGQNAAIYGVLLGPHLRGPNDLTQPYLVQKLLDPGDLLERGFRQLCGSPEQLTLALGLGLLVLGYAWLSARGPAWLLPKLACLGCAAVCASLLIVRETWSQGLFETTPVLILAIAALPAPTGSNSDAQRRDAQFWTWLRRTALLFLLGVVASPKVPGMDWGSRYLLTALPALFLLSWRTAQDDLRAAAGERRRGCVAVLAALSLVSLGSQARSVAAVKEEQRTSKHWGEVAREAATPVLLTEMFWLAPELAGETTGPTVLRWDGQPDSGRILIKVLRHLGSSRIGFLGTSQGLDGTRALLEEHGAQIEASRYYTDELISGERWQVSWTEAPESEISEVPR